jgi:hypothetical protein
MLTPVLGRIRRQVRFFGPYTSVVLVGVFSVLVGCLGANKDGVFRFTIDQRESAHLLYGQFSATDYIFQRVLLQASGSIQPRPWR